MPTGGGKSLCYQIPALLLPGLTVVVSPLIALMKDQVEQLRSAGVPALFLNSSLAIEDYHTNMQSIRRGQARLLYVAPETLLTPRLFGLLDAVQVSLFTIDEAHCISEWGHDFRPEYRQLVDARRRYPQAVCLALTATATARVRADIKSTLGFSESNEFIASFNRPNLFIDVIPKTEAFSQTVAFLERHKNESGIIYCFSRRQVDDLAAALAYKGYSTLPYHAGLEDDVRRRNQESFVRDDVQIMVATIAFGMGINKPNVRFILHHDLPKSIESYYQEIGRAGRDGLPAHCRLLYSPSDAAKINYFIKQKEGNERRSARQHLDALVRYAEDTSTCRRVPLLSYFGEQLAASNCGACDTCTAPPPDSADLPLVDITLPAQKFLSCVARTGERFGAVHITAVLRGSRSAKVLQQGHDKLSTYAIGNDWTEKQWMSLANTLVQAGYLQQEREFRTLQLTPLAREALRNRSPILAAAPEAGHGQPVLPAAQDLEYNAELFNLLRQRRKDLADEAGVPPYVIFSDRTLVEMATYFPQRRESLLSISGIGEVKLRQFGDIFLEILIPFCQEHQLQEQRPSRRPSSSAQKAGSPPSRSGPGERSMAVGLAFNAGESLESLMEQYGVTAGTILTHLENFTSGGHSLTNEKALQNLLGLCTASSSDREAALAAYAELGDKALKPVFERFEGRISYDDLKILRILYRSRQG
jgi:ATP-dependent DNA helicase RecQ